MVSHIYQILSPIHTLQNVVVLKKIQEVKSETYKQPRYLSLLIQQEANFKPTIQYEDELPFENLEQKAIEQDISGKSLELGASFERMKKLSRNGSIKISGYLKGYRYQYIEIQYNDIIAHYKNSIKFN